jgi:hypothetical protein
MRLRLILSILLSIACLAASIAVAGPDSEQGVYEYVVTSSTLDFDAAAAALDRQIAQSSLEQLATLNSTVPEGCSNRSRVYILHDSVYAAKLLEANAQTGAFAVPLRVNLFEDEQGVHVSIVNPTSINRTILLDDEKYASLSESARESLRELVSAAVPGQSSEKAYGPIREKGYIGKTMGVMAGGPFDAKVRVAQEVAGTDLTKVVQQLQNGIDEPEGKWGMKLAYSLALDEQGIAVLGMTSPKVESKSFSIVKAGGDKSRKKMECPGIDHAAAYPIEFVVTTQGDRLSIQLVESMYRMKMFFEDAGKWAFMKNMGMPGSIEDEMKTRIATSLE